MTPNFSGIWTSDSGLVLALIMNAGPIPLEVGSPIELGRLPTRTPDFMVAINDLCAGNDAFDCSRFTVVWTSICRFSATFVRRAMSHPVEFVVRGHFQAIDADTFCTRVTDTDFDPSAGNFVGEELTWRRTGTFEELLRRLGQRYTCPVERYT